MCNFLEIVTSPKVKGLVSLLGAGIMYFAPDHIDVIIEGLLGAFGCTQFFITPKK